MEPQKIEAATPTILIFFWLVSGVVLGVTCRLCTSSEVRTALPNQSTRLACFWHP
jgi:hypothetical protein